MLGHLMPGDVVTQATQRSYLAADVRTVAGQGRLEL